MNKWLKTVTGLGIFLTLVSTPARGLESRLNENNPMKNNPLQTSTEKHLILEAPFGSSIFGYFLEIFGDYDGERFSNKENVILWQNDIPYKTADAYDKRFNFDNLVWFLANNISDKTANGFDPEVFDGDAALAHIEAGLFPRIANPMHSLFPSVSEKKKLIARGVFGDAMNDFPSGLYDSEIRNLALAGITPKIAEQIPEEFYSWDNEKRENYINFFSSSLIPAEKNSRIFNRLEQEIFFSPEIEFIDINNDSVEKLLEKPNNINNYYLSLGRYVKDSDDLFHNITEAENNILTVIKYANQYGVDPLLAATVALIESDGIHKKSKKTTLSHAGAIGLMQLMDFTAERMGVDPYVLEENAEGGVKYLKLIMDEWDLDTSTPEQIAYIISNYNAGEKVGSRIPNNWETPVYAYRGLRVYRILEAVIDMSQSIQAQLSNENLLRARYQVFIESANQVINTQ
ncbi:transglycosylase SLT domain-containing protein [Nanoarchaeota archaeon]